jgi:hypothetical protein
MPLPKYPTLLLSTLPPHPTLQALPDLEESEVQTVFQALDLNGTGTVDVKEFFASLLQTMKPENQVGGA